jgi:hypothetical protein
VLADGDKTAYSGHATVKSRFKGRDFSSLYRLSRVYEVRFTSLKRGRLIDRTELSLLVRAAA